MINITHALILDYDYSKGSLITLARNGPMFSFVVGYLKISEPS